MALNAGMRDSESCHLPGADSTGQAKFGSERVRPPREWDGRSHRRPGSSLRALDVVVHNPGEDAAKVFKGKHLNSRKAFCGVGSKLRTRRHRNAADPSPNIALFSSTPALTTSASPKFNGASQAECSRAAKHLYRAPEKANQSRTCCFKVLSSSVPQFLSWNSQSIHPFPNRVLRAFCSQLTGLPAAFSSIVLPFLR